ncbi:MAG: hypothetical protein PVH94_05550, partial [Desulfobacterales bacterium]
SFSAICYFYFFLTTAILILYLIPNSPITRIKNSRLRSRARRKKIQKRSIPDSIRVFLIGLQQSPWALDAFLIWVLIQLI